MVLLKKYISNNITRKMHCKNKKKYFQWSAINDINTDRIKLYVTVICVEIFLPLFVGQR